MNRCARLLICLCLTVSLHAQGLNPEAITELKSYILKFQKEEQLAVVGFALVQNQEILFSGASSIIQGNKVSADTSFYVPALAEPMTTLLAAVLEKQGYLRMDDPVRRMDSRFKTQHSDQGRSITLEQLFTHTAGIPNYLDKTLAEDWARQSDVFATLQQTPVSGIPGERFEESSAGIAAAAYAMSAATENHRHQEEAFARTMAQHVFLPLNMTHTGYSAGPALAPAQHLYSSINDLAQWIMLEMSQGRLPNGSFLADPARMLQRQTPQRIQGAKQRGMGWYEQYYQMTPIVARGGKVGKHTSLAGFLPQYNVGFILYIESENLKSEKLAREIPLALVEFLKAGDKNN